MIVMMTVAETKSFEAAAKGVLSEDEVAKVITMVAEGPECGDLIKGTGGVRKVRGSVVASARCVVPWSTTSATSRSRCTC